MMEQENTGTGITIMALNFLEGFWGTYGDQRSCLVSQHVKYILLICYIFECAGGF